MGHLICGPSPPQIGIMTAELRTAGLEAAPVVELSVWLPWAVEGPFLSERVSTTGLGAEPSGTCCSSAPTPQNGPSSRVKALSLQQHGSIWISQLQASAPQCVCADGRGCVGASVRRRLEAESFAGGNPGAAVPILCSTHCAKGRERTGPRSRDQVCTQRPCLLAAPCGCALPLSLPPMVTPSPLCCSKKGLPAQPGWASQGRGAMKCTLAGAENLGGSEGSFVELVSLALNTHILSAVPTFGANSVSGL